MPVGWTLEGDRLHDVMSLVLRFERLCSVCCCCLTHTVELACLKRNKLNCILAAEAGNCYCLAVWTIHLLSPLPQKLNQLQKGEFTIFVLPHWGQHKIECLLHSAQNSYCFLFLRQGWYWIKLWLMINTKMWPCGSSVLLCHHSDGTGGPSGGGGLTVLYDVCRSDEDSEDESLSHGGRQNHDNLYRVHMPSLYSCGSSYGSETSIPAAAHTVSNAPVTEYM